jgi:hypothetical protein
MCNLHRHKCEWGQSYKMLHFVTINKKISTQSEHRDGSRQKFDVFEFLFFH